MKKLLIFLLLAIVMLSSTSFAQFPQEVKIGGFALGPQMWSFKLFTFAEGVHKAKEAGANVIEAFPGQQICPKDEAKFDHNADPMVWAKAKLVLEHAGVRLVNYGVVGWKTDAEL